MSMSPFYRRHWRHAAILGLIVLTGFGLFLPEWRKAAGNHFALVQTIHEWGGLFYGLAVLGLGGMFYPWPTKSPAKSPGFTRWAYFFIVMLFISGVGLLIGPSWTRSIATVTHAIFAFVFVGWVVWHLVAHIPIRIGKKKPFTLSLARRHFLGWAIGTAATLPVLWSLPSLAKVVSGRTIQQGEVQGALPGFVPYTVTNGYPAIDPATYHLEVNVPGNPIRLSYEQFKALPMIERKINFQCVTGWAVDGVSFLGVDLEKFLLSKGWDPKEKPWVLFYSADGVYTESLSAEQIHQYQPLIAWQIDHRPLPQSQGFPLRLLVPGMYGYKSIKWLYKIDFADQDVLGYWEQRGYPENAYLGSYNGL
ncbi:molybdopterin-dependent oxidoreductase [Sulfobacillus thermosulfidooxidans]|uniref:molybdopterin-dependent oxidoreductase n=1 Tax=Sulfobacillus thermosulfidooxidans TaxID=28034 RepID=UPI00096B9D90|nr:molybdopterin-dependent oxidoreductase [Sulfobacillus thermosulfidooxidans]OLZ11585.1 hypothetical protein BFX05_06190 [Sulfobacillus thermosulfidooxidans]OLZ17427.1 hypothetical protein BFX06_13620 [Sulfobacillus thermosulfidooxidans]OLZ21063.1 hypothetical protein BFX07_13675 [Sulfobacillus thermosulfidooxidans]